MTSWYSLRSWSSISVSYRSRSSALKRAPPSAVLQRSAAHSAYWFAHFARSRAQPYDRDRRQRNAALPAGHTRMIARPTTVRRRIVPNTRLSDELDRLSPMTHRAPLGTVTGPKSDVVAPGGR